MSSGRTRQRIALITHSYFDEDPRLRRQAEALIAAGHEVDVLALRRPDDPPSADVGGARVLRLDVQRHQGAGVGRYLAEYLSFFFRVAWRLVAEHARRRYRLVQVATLPDWLVFAAMPLRLVGVPVVIDLHEAMPEFFASRFPRLSRGPTHRAIGLVERLSIAAATHALTANDALRDRLVARGVAERHVTVVPNAPSLARFDPASQPPRAFMADGRLRLVYAGALTPTYDLGLAIRALRLVVDRRPELQPTLELYGRGDAEMGLREAAAALGLSQAVRFHGRVPVEAIPAAIAAADIGLATVEPSRFTALSLSTKIFEYGAMRRAVVAARLALAERLFGPDRIWLYEPGDAEGLAAAIVDVVDAGPRRDARIEAMAARVGELAWDREGPRYVELIEALAAGVGVPHRA